MQVTEVDQGMGYGGEIALGPLDLEHLAIALFRAWKIVHECAGITEVPKGVRQRLLIIGSPIIGDCRFPGRASLNEISAMEENPCAMFVVVRHEIVNRYS